MHTFGSCSFVVPLHRTNGRECAAKWSPGPYSARGQPGPRARGKAAPAPRRSLWGPPSLLVVPAGPVEKREENPGWTPEVPAGYQAPAGPPRLSEAGGVRPRRDMDLAAALRRKRPCAPSDGTLATACPRVAIPRLVGGVRHRPGTPSARRPCRRRPARCGCRSTRPEHRWLAYPRAIPWSTPGGGLGSSCGRRRGHLPR